MHSYTGYLLHPGIVGVSFTEAVILNCIGVMWDSVLYLSRECGFLAVLWTKKRKRFHRRLYSLSTKMSYW